MNGWQCNDALDKLKEEFSLDMNIYYLRHFLNKTGEGPGGKFNGPSVKTVLKNLDDLAEQLPEEAGSFINYLDSIKKLHRMCTEEKLSDNYREVIEEFKEAFENVHQLFGLSETLKVHVILSHYSDYFELTGKTFKETNGEHHEALHHTLKTMERNKNLYMRKNHGGVIHQQKTHQSISTRNVLSAGFTPKAKLRIRKSRTSSVSSNSPRSSPMKSSPLKKVFNHSKSFITNFLNRIDE